MLKILERQIAALDAFRLEERTARHADWLHAEFPALTSDNAALQARLAELSADARALGFVTEHDELRFIRLSYLPEATLTAPANAAVIARVLNDTDASPSARLDFIERHLGARLRPRSG